jgi:hypothetical protein
VISDIVKRRSIRAWIAKHAVRHGVARLALSPEYPTPLPRKRWRLIDVLFGEA